MRHWERSDKSDKVLNEKMLFLMRIGLRSSIGKCGLLKRRHTLFFLRKRQAHLHLYSHLTLLRTAYFLLQARARAKRVERCHKRMLKNGRNSSQLCVSTNVYMGTAMFQPELTENGNLWECG
jgi:hypothetical protein